MMNVGQFESAVQAHTLQDSEYDTYDYNKPQSFEGLSAYDEDHCKLLLDWASDTLPEDKSTLVYENVEILFDKDDIFGEKMQTEAFDFVSNALGFIDIETLKSFLKIELSHMSDDDFYDTYGITHPDNLE
jgi:hypothetical protein